MEHGELRERSVSDQQLQRDRDRVRGGVQDVPRRSPQLTNRYTALARRPRYAGFLLTVSLARISATMFNTSGVLLVLARTGSAPLAGATAAAATLPSALSGPVLGAWLDVAKHRRVLIVADQVLSVIGLLGVVALAGHAPNWTVPAVTVLYSVTRPLSTGSFFSTLAEISGPELLDEASRIEATSLNLAFTIGPALGGVLSGAAGPATAIEIQAGITVIVGALIAINPAFEARHEHKATSVTAAIRAGTRAIVRDPVLRANGIGSTLATFGWGLMAVGFPLYAVRSLHASAHTSGYMWAAVALGSILGTFALRGRPSSRRIAASYAVLGVSALLWPLAEALAVGLLLIALTGFLEGPAYSGTIALRQRLTPPAVRAQSMSTIASAGLLGFSAGAAVGGTISGVTTLVVVFAVVNLIAAAAVISARWARAQRLITRS
ncbi:MAG TPA: MFS transporter [Solirubrobacteraceae bacterium]